MRKINVSDFNLEKFKLKFNKLSKIAERLGCEQPTYKIIDTYKHKLSDGMIDIIHVIELDYNVVINGYEYVAFFDHVENIVYGEYPTDLFKPTECKCDHCNINRYRMKTYIIKKGDDYKQVGGSCLINYLGHELKMHLLPEAFTEAELGGLEFGGSGKCFYDLNLVLELSIMSVKSRGFYKTNDNYPTKQHVYELIIGKESTKKLNYNQVTEQEIQDHIDYMLSLENSEIGSYNYNLFTIAKNGYCSYTSMGILVSVVNAYILHKERLSQQNAELNSQHIGDIKQRITTEIKMISVYIMEGDFGYTSIVKMIDESGNIIIWKASGYKSFEIDAKYSLTGTISKHDEYKGIKQTLVQRCKLEIVE